MIRKVESLSAKGFAMETASALIDKRIEELADWRGKTLARARGESAMSSATWRRRMCGLMILSGGSGSQPAVARGSRTHMLSALRKASRVPGAIAKRQERR